MLHGVFLSFAAYFCYSVSDVFNKLLNYPDVNVPPYMMAYFYAIIGILSLPFIKTRDESWRDVIIPRNWLMWFLRATASTTGLISAIVAFSNLSMAETYAIIFMQPAVSSLFSILFLREHVDKKRWLSIIVGFVGVLVVMRPGLRELNIGHLGAIICCMSNAVGINIVRRMQGVEKRITLYASSLIGALVVGGAMTQPLFGVGLIFDWQSSILADWRTFMALTAYSVLAVVGTMCLLGAAKRVTVTFVALPQYSQIVLAIMFDYFLFYKLLDAYIGVGIALIIASNLMTFLREEQADKGQPVAVLQKESR